MRPAHAAFAAAPALPLTVVVGVPSLVKVRMMNDGTATWGSGVRLGAAPGCPEAARTNEIAWKVSAAAGFAHGATDARVFTTGAGTRPGETAEFTFEVVAASKGPQVLAARMVDEGHAWFGAVLLASRRRRRVTFPRRRPRDLRG